MARFFQVTEAEVADLVNSDVTKKGIFLWMKLRMIEPFGNNYRPMPTKRELATELKTTIQTIRKELKKLIKAKLIVIDIRNRFVSAYKNVKSTVGKVRDKFFCPDEKVSPTKEKFREKEKSFADEKKVSSRPPEPLPIKTSEIPQKLQKDQTIQTGEGVDQKINTKDKDINQQENSSTQIESTSSQVKDEEAKTVIREKVEEQKVVEKEESSAVEVVQENLIVQESLDDSEDTLKPASPAEDDPSRGSQAPEVPPGDDPSPVPVSSTQQNQNEDDSKGKSSSSNGELPDELLERLRGLEIKLTEQVIQRIKEHHISQAYGAATHVENTWETIINPTSVFLYQLPKQPIEKLGQRLSEEMIEKLKEENEAIEQERQSEGYKSAMQSAMARIRQILPKKKS